MLIFFKANIASGVSTLFDYVVAMFAVYILQADPVMASLTGGVFGGVVNFLIGRYWAFNERQTSSYQQAYRYSIVWIGSLLLNACGTQLFIKYCLFQFIAAKTVTAVIVAMGYNFPLQKNFVFVKKINDELS